MTNEQMSKFITGKCRAEHERKVAGCECGGTTVIKGKSNINPKSILTKYGYNFIQHDCKCTCTAGKRTLYEIWERAIK